MSERPVRDEPVGGSGGKITARHVIAQPCGSPAPLSVNGGGYTMCGLGLGHDGMHCVEIRWAA